MSESVGIDSNLGGRTMTRAYSADIRGRVLAHRGNCSRNPAPWMQERCGLTDLALAGGCAVNSGATGEVTWGGWCTMGRSSVSSGFGGGVRQAIRERGGRQAPRSQQILERGRKQIAKLRRSVRPLIGHILAMMAEEFQVELEAAAGEQANNLTHVVEE